MREITRKYVRPIDRSIDRFDRPTHTTRSFFLFLFFPSFLPFSRIISNRRRYAFTDINYNRNRYGTDTPNVSIVFHLFCNILEIEDRYFLPRAQHAFPSICKYSYKGRSQTVRDPSRARYVRRVRTRVISITRDASNLNNYDRAKRQKEIICGIGRKIGVPKKKKK